LRKYLGSITSQAFGIMKTSERIEKWMAENGLSIDDVSQILGYPDTIPFKLRLNDNAFSVGDIIRLKRVGFPDTYKSLKK
jgi:hypothetical protein